MHHNFITLLKRKSGIAIMSVMLFFVVMTLFLGALSFTAVGNARVSGTNSQSMAAFYAAEAGIATVLNEFKRVQEVTETTDAAYLARIRSVVTHFQTNPTVNLTSIGGSRVFATLSFRNIVDNPTAQTYSVIVISTGNVAGRVRVLETQVDIEYGDLSGNNTGFAIRHSILVRGNLSVGANAIINTNVTNGTPRVATFSASNNAMSFHQNATFTGGKIELTQAGYDRRNHVVSSSFQSYIDPTNRVTSTPFAVLDFQPIRNIVSSTSFTSVAGISTLLSNTNAQGEYLLSTGNYSISSLDFSTVTGVVRTSGNVLFVTDRLTLGNVRFVGSGTVTIYVRPGQTSGLFPTNFSFAPANNAVFGNQSAPQQLVIYVDSMSTPVGVVMTNNSSFYGAIMFKNHSVTLNNGTTFGGFLLTEGSNVTLSNNGTVTTTFVYAPLGNVHLSENGGIRGAIIANSATIQNRAVVTFDPSAVSNLPFAVTSPLVTTAPPSVIGTRIFRIHQTIER